METVLKMRAFLAKHAKELACPEPIYSVGLDEKNKIKDEFAVFHPLPGVSSKKIDEIYDGLGQINKAAKLSYRNHLDGVEHSFSVDYASADPKEREHLEKIQLSRERLREITAEMLRIIANLPVSDKEKQQRVGMLNEYYRTENPGCLTNKEKKIDLMSEIGWEAHSAFHRRERVTIDLENLLGYRFGPKK